ncbi:MAG TPA: hypothetical protein VFX37_09795 [Pseudolabrys sp.]|nr:hypothetical protein [Pseudolabrys sp.]
MSNEQPSNVATLPVQRHHVQLDVFADPASFEHAQRVAKVFATSNLVPAHLRNNVADCLIAYQIARRLNEEPLTVFQNIYVVSGRPGWKTEYVIARANKAGVFKDRITWASSGQGDKLAVTATATLADTGTPVSVTCDMAMAKAEEWTRNKKYTSMPEHMLRWRSATMLIRLYAPEVMLGMPVLEEIETLPDMRDVTPQQPSKDMRETLDEFAGAQKPREEDTVNSETANDVTAETQQQTATVETTDAPPTATDLDEPAPAEEAPKEPRNAQEYMAMLTAHVDAASDHAALKSWFLSKEQKDLRGKCGVIGGNVDAAKNYTLKKIEELKAKK